MTDKPAKKQRTGPPPSGADPERIAAARALYEGQAGQTIPKVAKATGIAIKLCYQLAREQEWVRFAVRPASGKMSEDAHRIADSYTRKVGDLGDEISAEEKADRAQAAADEVAEEEAARQKAQLLDRHRREWSAPRALSAEAVKNRDFERAKLAKITAETLKLVQDGERRSWGIDSSGSSQTFQIVIDRE